ncbi:MAG TPA: hypothetical protein VNO33_17705 [Kofleriaceae bacterium]|nr:hypothetical protein [Kofleriaceae bacterium]
MKKILTSLLVAACLSSVSLAGAAEPSTAPSKKPDAAQQHKAKAQSQTRARHKAHARKAKARTSDQTSQKARDKNLH